jgi:hypothetical protein
VAFGVAAIEADAFKSSPSALAPDNVDVVYVELLRCDIAVLYVGHPEVIDAFGSEFPVEAYQK